MSAPTKERSDAQAEFAPFITNDGTRSFSWATGIRDQGGKTYQREVHQWFFWARLRHRKMRRLAQKWTALVRGGARP